MLHQWGKYSNNLLLDGQVTGDNRRELILVGDDDRIQFLET